MSDGRLLAAISAFANELPQESADALARVIVESPTREVALRRSANLIGHHRFTERSRTLFNAWADDALPPRAVALALRAAAQRTKEVRGKVQLEPVWTGPDLREASFRRSEQALLEVISAARGRLLVVSYAVHEHAEIKRALADAADSGVSIEIVVESPVESEGRMTADALKVLGPAVTSRCAVLVWPAQRRKRDSAGHAGVLHAKCAVADRSVLLVSSANLTERAMTNNIELGLVVRGGPLPGAIASAFAELRARGDLVPVS